MPHDTVFPQKSVLNSAEQKELKDASDDYLSCLNADFMPRFLAGEKLNVDDFCKSELAAVRTLNGDVV